MVWISSQSKSKDRINKEARGTQLDQEESKPHVKEVLRPNKRNEMLQGLRQPKQSHSFSMTPEDQGIHKIGENGLACLQKCSYNTTDTTAHGGTSSSSAAAWTVTTSTFLHTLESPRPPSSMQQERLEVTSLPWARPRLLLQRHAVLWPLPWAAALGISLCLI